MAWFTRKKKNLKKETLERKPFQNLRNKYTNIKSSVKNYFGERQAKKEGKPYRRTQRMAESRERMQTLSNAVAREKKYKAAQRENKFTNANLNAAVIDLSKLTNINIGDTCNYLEGRMKKLKGAIDNLNDDEDPRNLSKLYNAYSSKFYEYHCEEEKNVENLFPGPKTPPASPLPPQNIVPQYNNIKLSNAIEYTPEQQLTNVINWMAPKQKTQKKEKRLPKFFQPPLKPYKGSSRKYTRKH